MCRINGTHTHPHCNCLSEKTLHHVATAVPELLRSSGGSSEICLVITSMSFINKRAWTFGHCCCWRWRWCISYVGRNDHSPNIKYTTPCFNLQWCQKRKGARSSMENFNFFYTWTWENQTFMLGGGIHVDVLLSCLYSPAKTLFSSTSGSSLCEHKFPFSSLLCAKWGASCTTAHVIKKQLERRLSRRRVVKNLVDWFLDAQRCIMIAICTASSYLLQSMQACSPWWASTDVIPRRWRETSALGNDYLSFNKNKAGKCHCLDDDPRDFPSVDQSPV